MAEENFTPFKGKRININDVGSKEGRMLFSYDTGELFFDTRTENQPTKISRIPVNANKLIESSVQDNGVLRTETIAISDIKRKMDKASPLSDPKPNQKDYVALLDSSGQVYRSDYDISNIANGVNAIYTQISLVPENWTPYSKNQTVGVPNLTADSVVIVSPASINSGYNIYCSEQGEGTLIFTCLDDEIPREIIFFNIIIYTDIAGGDSERYFIKSLIGVENWSSVEGNNKVKRAKVYDDKIKMDSILIPSMTNYEDAMNYHIYGVGQGETYIEFETFEVPDKPISVNILIENYRKRGE